MTTEHEQELELKLSHLKDIEKDHDEVILAVKKLLKSLPRWMVINILKELKIIKIDYVTKEVKLK